MSNGFTELTNAGFSVIIGKNENAPVAHGVEMKIKDIEIKNGICLAPLAGVSDRTFRRMARRYGAEYTVSEMVSAKALCYEQLWEPDPYQQRNARVQPPWRQCFVKSFPWRFSSLVRIRNLWRVRRNCSSATSIAVRAVRCPPR